MSCRRGLGGAAGHRCARPGTGENGRAAGLRTKAHEAVGSGPRARVFSLVSKVVKINVIFTGEKKIK